MSRTVSARAQAPRDPANKTTDIAAVRAIAQAAIDVELFTIPLYMTSLYSIEGYREINSAADPEFPHGPLYKGRLWPGAAPVATPSSANEAAFNMMFSIFIEEMLHLQMAANMAAVIGVEPSFTSAALQSPAYGWVCYGKEQSVIPHIIDLTDTTNENVPVELGPLDVTRLQLFLAIEQDEATALENILPQYRSNYTSVVAPLPNWTPAQPLPLFGTIGNLYRCYWDYLNFTYTDGSTLWEAVYTPLALDKGQQDYFNCARSSNPDSVKPQYPQIGLYVDPASSGAPALAQMGQMMDAITDQGEGSLVTAQLGASVEPQYRASCPNLESDYPSYDDNGQPVASTDAAARCQNDGVDHYTRFQTIQGMLPQIVTWATAGKSGNWSAGDLVTAGYDPANPYNIPTPEEVASAMNAMTEPGSATHNFDLLSKAIVADIAAVTTTLNRWWSATVDPTLGFPEPSMGQAGSRMSTIWAVLGATPDLSLGLPALQPGKLYNSCQGLSLEQGGTNSCAAVEIFHGCIGTNGCQAQGGCGFVHSATTSGGNCSSPAIERFNGTSQHAGASGCGVKCGGGADADAVKCGSPAGGAAAGGGKVEGGCGAPTIFSAPGDNKCAGFGGCSVPISASQLYPKDGYMRVFDFTPVSGGWQSKEVDPPLPFAKGDSVPAIAYKALAQVLQSRDPKVTPPPMPAPDILRLVFPPTT